MLEPKVPPRWAFPGLLLSIAAGLAAAWSVLYPAPANTAVAVAALWLIWNAWLLGRLLFRNQGPACQLTFGALCLAGLISVAGAACYYLWIWNSLATSYVIGGVSLVSAAGLFVGNRTHETDSASDQDSSSLLSHFSQALLALLWLAAAGLVVHAALTHATSEPIRSPWAALPSYVPAVFAIATVSLVALSAIARRSWVLALWAGHGAIATGIAWLVYRTGYGFDPFVHQATEKLLLANGTFSPAPPYYLGQYALVTLIQRLSHLSLVSIDRALVPLAAGILLPCLAFWTLRRNFRTKVSVALIASGAILALPLAPFIVTTPHALALLYSCAAVAAAVFFLEQKFSSAAMFIAAAAAVATHPLVGVPVAVFVVLVAAWRRSEKSSFSRITFWTLCLLSPFAVPAMFVVNGILNPANAASLVPFNFATAWSQVGSWLAPHAVTMFDVKDGAYLYLFNLPALGLALLATSLWFLWNRDRLNRFAVLALGAAATTISAAILAASLRLDFLIDYERTAFADRLLLVATIIASPLLLVALYRLLRRLQARGLFGNVAMIGLISGGISIGFFLTYPTFDQYRKDRGYNTAAVDFEAVEKIEADAKGTPYVVLANQATAAAAVSEFGFDRLHKGNYFYPLPTGSPLYQLYLDFVYKGPSVGTISKVRELTGVQRVYVAVSSYWDSSDLIQREAQTTTAKWFIVGSTSTVSIFRYD